MSGTVTRKRGRPADPNFKKCPCCGVTKPRTEFYGDKSKSYNTSSRCISCMRTNHYKLYGLTANEYRERLERQRGRCAICQREEPTGRQLCVDHDHDTGLVRELLCLKCNTGLGVFKDNPDLLAAAIRYLKKHKK